MARLCFHSFVIVVWNTENCLKEAYKQLDDRGAYKQVPNDSNVQVDTIMKFLEKTHLRGDLPSAQSIIFFKDPTFSGLYLSSKIRKCLHHLPVEQLFQTVASTLKKIFSFSDYHI